MIGAVLRWFIATRHIGLRKPVCFPKDPTDLANLETADRNHDTLAGIVNEFGTKLRPGARIAFLVQSTVTPSYVDHLLEVARRVRLPVENRMTVPYGLNKKDWTFSGWARKNRKMLQ